VRREPGTPVTGEAERLDRAASTAARGSQRSRNLVSGLLLGVGIAAFVDETVFHQLLHWHHFYDKSTPAVGLVSDGIFHAFGWFATVGALFLLADLFRRHAVWWTRWWGGVLLGAGSFQLYDGMIQHKLLGLHQIRYDVDLLPYDVTWNILAAVMILIGLYLVWRTRRSRAAATPTEPGA
jgi:uncharacterized membrane protein